MHATFIHFRKRKQPNNRERVACQGEAKLTRQDFKNLSQVSQVQKPTKHQIEGEFPQLFSPGIGSIKGMKANLPLKDDAHPKFMKARTVPYALKEKIEKELDNLESQGIITKVT